MNRLYNCWATVNRDKNIVNTSNMVEEFQGYAAGLVFGYVGIQFEYIDYLICVYGPKCIRDLPSDVISE